MEASSFDDFCLAPPGWSDSSLPESDDCGALLLEAFLSYVDIDAAAAQPASSSLCWFTLPKSDNNVERAKCREVF